LLYLSRISWSSPVKESIKVPNSPICIVVVVGTKASALVKLNYDKHNSILTDLYGAEALVPTTTTMHIGEFGTFIDSLTGLDQLILDKYNKSK